MNNFLMKCFREIAIVAVMLTMISAVSFAQGAPSITLAWPTSDVVMLPGIEVGVYGQIVGTTSGITPVVAIQDHASSNWLHADGSWGSQQWLTASIVDTAGNWRYMLTPNRSGSFSLIAKIINTAGVTESNAQTTFQVQGSGSSSGSGGGTGSGSSTNPGSSSDSITLAWPTANVAMMPGVQVGIWGIATGSKSATVSVAVQNSQTGQWLNGNGSWGAQTWISAPIVDAAGTWRWMYMPASGGSFLVVARLTDGSTTEQASSTFSVLGGSAPTSPTPPTSPPPSGTGTFPLTIVNGTNGRWRNSDIWLTIIGQATPGNWAYVTPDGATHHVDHTQANAPSHLTYGGVNYPSMSFQVPASGVITMPSAFQGGRVYISLGSPLYLSIPTNDSGIALPDVNNPSDPNSNTYWDFYEFTFVNGQVAYGGNSTQVDQFGFPINVRVTQQATGFDRSTSYLVSRTDIWNHFLNSSDPSYRELVGTYHILAPRTSAPFSKSTATANMQAYINTVWQQYATTGFSLTRLGQTFAGDIQSDNNLHFSFQGTPGYVLHKPTAEDVWQCSGALASGNGQEEALGAEFCAAFNRGVAQTTSEWEESSQYYRGTVENEYAAYLHSICSDARTYAFAYDDINDQSTVIILPNSAPPSNVTLTVAW